MGIRLVPWLVLALGLGTTGLLDASIARSTFRRHDDDFGREVARLQGAVEGAVQRQISVLQATAGVVAANPEIDRLRFAAFYRHLALGEDARSLEGIGLILSRPWTQRADLVEEAARRGAGPFVLRPPGPRSEADAVMLVQPPEPPNLNAVGYDMHADPLRRPAMDRARTTGLASMTAKVFLAKDVGARIPSFVFYLRVDRADRLVFSAIHAARLFEGLLPGERPDEKAKIGVTIWSGSRSDANRVFASDFSGKVAYRRSVGLPLPEVGATLAMDVVASSEFGPPGAVRPWIVPTGAAISVLLFFLAMNLSRAHEATRRRESEQTLLAEVGRLTAGSAEFGEEALRSIADAATGTLDAMCRIDWFDPDGEFRTTSTRTEGAEALAALEREYPRERADPLLRRAMETGRPQRAPGYEAIDERHRTLVDALRAGPVLIAPMRLGDRALGAMTFVRRPERPGFSAEAAALAETIASRVALALDNARLYHDLERRVEERTRDLEASNRELESFCYSVSHDLRTPLRSLDGFGRVLKEDYGDRLDDQGRDYLDRIQAAAKRMDELITALLTLSRLTRREIVPSDVDVTAMVEDQLHDLDGDRRIWTTVKPGLKVHADPRMLAVLFDNLLSNAVKFSSRIENPTIEVGRAEDGSIFVRDNGAGFDMAYASKLFQPFERLHSPREFPGHGIGLATVERIVRRHGGELRAEGRPGEGATFYFRLPD